MRKSLTALIVAFVLLLTLGLGQRASAQPQAESRSDSVSARDVRHVIAKGEILSQLSLMFTRNGNKWRDASVQVLRLNQRTGKYVQLRKGQYDLVYPGDVAVFPGRMLATLPVDIRGQKVTGSQFCQQKLSSSDSKSCKLVGWLNGIKRMEVALSRDTIWVPPTLYNLTQLVKDAHSSDTARAAGATVAAGRADTNKSKQVVAKDKSKDSSKKVMVKSTSSPGKNHDARNALFAISAIVAFIVGYAGRRRYLDYKAAKERLAASAFTAEDDNDHDPGGGPPGGGSGIRPSRPEEPDDPARWRAQDFDEHGTSEPVPAGPRGPAQVPEQRQTASRRGHLRLQTPDEPSASGPIPERRIEPFSSQSLVGTATMISGPLRDAMLAREIQEDMASQRPSDVPVIEQAPEVQATTFEAPAARSA